jgi:hypothetical protein
LRDDWMAGMTVVRPIFAVLITPQRTESGINDYLLQER